MRIFRTSIEYRFTMDAGEFFLTKSTLIRANDANGFSALSGRVKIFSV